MSATAVQTRASAANRRQELHSPVPMENLGLVRGAVATLEPPANFAATRAKDGPCSRIVRRLEALWERRSSTPVAHGAPTGETDTDYPYYGSCCG